MKDKIYIVFKSDTLYASRIVGIFDSLQAAEALWNEMINDSNPDNNVVNVSISDGFELNTSYYNIAK